MPDFLILTSLFGFGTTLLLDVVPDLTSSPTRPYASAIFDDKLVTPLLYQ
jgi:hypothetical protein